MVDRIIRLDRELFVWLNSFGSEKYDGLWLFITSQINWLPIFLLIGYLAYKRLGWKHATMVLLLISFLVLFTDQTTNLIKNAFQRLRPGNEPEVAKLIRIIQTRKSYSFISGHASNSMACAMFLFLIMRRYLRHMWLIFFWPLIFAYSRIYLGLHYPLDILCGYLWGTTTAFLMWEIYRIILDRNFPQKENLDHPTHG